MPMLACPTCRRFYKVKRVGVFFEEGFLPNGGTSWAPYKLWAGDLFECEGCGGQVIGGVGFGPIAEHYQPDYQARVEKAHPLCRIDDCEGAFLGPVEATP